MFIREAYSNLMRKELIADFDRELTVVNRYNRKHDYNPKYDRKFRFDIQMMFNYTEKVGIAMWYDTTRLLFSGEDFFILVLLSVGLLILRVDDMKFKHFVPLVGTYMRRTERPKLSDQFAMDIYTTASSNEYETIIFGSSLDLQEWVTKIQKVQRTHRDGIMI